MKKCSLVFVIVIAALVATVKPVAAQAPVSYVLRVYNAGATAPIQTTSAPATALVCNQSEGLPARTLNEARAIVWDDPSNPGKVCALDFAAFFGGLPIGSFTFTIVGADSAGHDYTEESTPTLPLARLGPAVQHPRVVRGGGQ